MAKIIFRQEAINDLSNIWDYTLQKWSEKQADHYYSIIKLACHQIGLNPILGKEYNRINDKLQGLKSGKHIIFYHQISESEIEIIRILYERMDLKKQSN